MQAAEEFISPMKETAMSNVKKVMVGLVIFLILFVIFLQLDIGVSRAFITKFKKICNIQLSCQNLYAAPLSTGKKVGDEQKAAFLDNLCKQKNASEGCMLNAFVENKSDHKAYISEANIVVSKIKKISLSEIKLLGSYRNNQITCHIVNNGDKAWKNINVQLYGYCNTDSGYKMLEDEKLAEILNISAEELMMQVAGLEPGEILNMKNFDVNSEQLSKVSGVLNIGYKTFKKDKRTEIDRGLLGKVISENAQIQFSVDNEAVPEVEGEEVIIDVQKNKMQRISVDKKFSVKPRKQMLLQSVVYPTQSCEIEAYLELVTAEGKTKKTKVMTQKILVPKYKINDGLYTEVRDWITANNITNYKYNENPQLEAAILE